MSDKIIRTPPTKPGFYWIKGTATVIRLDEHRNIKDSLLPWEPAECYHNDEGEQWDYLWGYLGDEEEAPTIVGPRIEPPKV